LKIPAKRGLTGNEVDKIIIKYLGKTHCPLCEEQLDPYATYPFNRGGQFPCFWHTFCIEKIARWFRYEGHRIEWKSGKIMLSMTEKGL